MKLAHQYRRRRCPGGSVTKKGNQSGGPVQRTRPALSVQQDQAVSRCPGAPVRLADERRDLRTGSYQALL